MWKLLTSRGKQINQVIRYPLKSVIEHLLTDGFLFYQNQPFFCLFIPIIHQADPFTAKIDSMIRKAAS
jgi:hypothetical protein